ncbi:MAG TPA: potassium-transporting ATPase subunit KdpA, partial [Streptosporangiaceae bacterium]
MSADNTVGLIVARGPGDLPGYSPAAAGEVLMSNAAAGQASLLVFALAVSYRPLGDYMARILTTGRHWRAERGLYKVMGVDPDADQQWSAYLRSVLAFSAVSVLFLYAFERVQHYLWLSLGFPNVPSALAWNTAASFTSNTNWQNYSGESTMGHLVQMAELAVQNFASAAVGIRSGRPARGRERCPGRHPGGRLVQQPRGQVMGAGTGTGG